VKLPAGPREGVNRGGVWSGLHAPNNKIGRLVTADLFVSIQSLFFIGFRIVVTLLT
jgi:hypothetical protein